jgi:O-antigen/teichoic acid export membrane protein
MGLGMTWLFAVSTAAALAQVLLIRRIAGAGRESFHPGPVLGLMREGWPIVAAAVLTFVYGKADGLIMALVASNEAVAIYSVAYKVFQAAMMGAGILSATTVVKLAASTAGDTRRLESHFRLGTRVSMWVGAIIAVSGIFISDLVMRVVAGTEYAVGGPVLSLLLIAVSMAYATALAGPTIALLGYQRRYLLQRIPIVLTNIVANLLLIPRFGAMGAASAMVLTGVLGMVASFAILWRGAGLSINWAHAIGSVLGIAASVAVGAFVSIHLGPVAAAAAAGLMCAGLLVATGLVRPAEIRSVLRS